ncbi:D-tyrosyl-tRNA(Tyr) deacylase [Chlorobaculum parvum NCIB 8327]|uniref:D-aminoacyl-tRNA deacylase n=1 Tax=Chlorobaculum parvum (strain DSM 263 / NCIMB 8327) TaxID=517417 RepID=DTD_CHLP8|nr:D-aminoacyl-tRNA deacylase [Chlorobaculum parvum]B3QL07.1 RecName: Full=D-aminoacyl-tRNA deacylase; Short=DTD; AltName: Full=Gly-tRNA(Ala) deacylase [Chlorobaculum parvum NCIB 8327]ACF10795.1 D-tyrosyl-tRNA(Tyr) deacylase [Chlorobaculum parvum NCIB 8327]
MRCVVQRVREASVTIGGERFSSIGAGLLVLAGISREDTEADLAWMSRKLPNLRIFEDDEGRMNRSVKEIGGELLVVSQFTLYADASRGNRPGFTESAPSEVAQPLFDRFVELLRRESGLPVETGSFGADMQVSLINDGPVTIILESPKK